MLKESLTKHNHRCPVNEQDSDIFSEILLGLSDTQIAEYMQSNTIQGLVKVSINSKGEDKPFFEKNLVVLTGREFVAQKVSGIPNTKDNIDLRDYEIRYFGYGSGGSSQEPTPNKIGPYSTDEALQAPAHFNSESTDLDSSFKYIKQGNLKRILSDGSIKIVDEQHSVSEGRNTIITNKPTAIKYTLNVDTTEIKKFPFTFSECGLYYTRMKKEGDVELPYGDSTETKQNADSKLFARFTTSPKELEEGESLTIEWFILA